VVSKHRIADLLWGEMLPRDFVATVESHVSVLRRRLREALPASERAIVTEPGGYRLDPECVRVDLDDFDELLTIAATSSNGVAEGHLMEAIGLIRGDVFEDEPYSVWAESLRGHYRPRAVGALLDAARHALARADFDRALELAQRVLAMDTEVEAAYQIEMIGYYRLGRQEEALRAFGRCQKTLAYDLAVEPLEMTMELAWAIRHHDGAQMSEWSLNAPIWLNGRRP
jgi:DNA-binding SARP family transcriptional activator